MDELEFKRRQLSDPDAVINELRNQLNLSHAEREQLKQLEDFEADLAAAVEVKVPEQLAEKILLNTDMHKPAKKRFTIKRFMAMAASVGVVSFLALRLLLFTPSSAVAQDALGHLYHDIQHLGENQLDAGNRMQRAMKAVGMSHELSLKELTFAGNCHIGKRPGVHLVININSHAYTVFLLPSLEVEKAESFSDDNFHGKIVSINEGGLIVIGMKNSELKSVVDSLKHKFANFETS